MRNHEWKTNNWILKIIYPIDSNESYRILLTNKNKVSYSYPFRIISNMVKEDRLFEIPTLNIDEIDSMKRELKKVFKHIEQRLL